MGETEKRESEGEKENAEKEQTDEGEDKSEGKPVEETAPQTEEREQLDLNEMARKQGLTTDDEFQSLMEGRSRGEEDTVQMAEGLDLASGAVGTEERSGKSGKAERATPPSEKEAVEKQPQEGTTSLSEGREVEKNQPEEERPRSKTPQPEAGEGKETKQPATGDGIPPEEPERAAPRVSKTKPTTRRLVLKGDPDEGRPTQRRVSQRCLGRWTASKAG